MSNRRLGIFRLRFRTKGRRAFAANAAVFLIAAGAVAFDALTPQLIDVGLFYVAIVLAGFWFERPAAFLLAGIATILIIAGYWLTIPDNSPVWMAWLNRVLAIATVWLTASFVGHIRGLEKKLWTQIELANSLSHEMGHRVGNALQLVASFLRLQAAHTPSNESRRVLETAGSRVMTIAKIQRTLSHLNAPHAVDSKVFLAGLVRDVTATLPDPERIRITIHADPAKIDSIAAIVLGAMLIELIHNAVKYAFRPGMDGRIGVSFRVPLDGGQWVVEVEDDGIGIDETKVAGGFGTHSVAELARLVKGSITCGAAAESDDRPGTKWRLEFPRDSNR